MYSFIGNEQEGPSNLRSREQLALSRTPSVDRFSPPSAQEFVSYNSEEYTDSDPIEFISDSSVEAVPRKRNAHNGSAPNRKNESDDMDDDMDDNSSDNSDENNSLSDFIVHSSSDSDNGHSDSSFSP